MNLTIQLLIPLLATAAIVVVSRFDDSAKPKVGETSAISPPACAGNEGILQMSYSLGGMRYVCFNGATEFRPNESRVTVK